MTGTRSCGGAGRGSRRGAGTPVTVSQRQVRVHGQRVSYLEAGVGRSPVVVLLHGLASSSATWADVMPLIGRRAHVIAPDLLGHGGSAKPRSGDYSLGAHAAAPPGCATCSPSSTWSGPPSWGTPSAGAWLCSSRTSTPN